MIQRMNRCYNLSLFLRRQNHHQRRRQLRSVVSSNDVLAHQQKTEEEEEDYNSNNNGNRSSNGNGNGRAATFTCAALHLNSSLSSSSSSLSSPSPSPLSVKRGFVTTTKTATTTLPLPLSKAPFSLSHNQYHTTTKKEILPLIAVGSLAVLGTYSYRALKRMDDEWDDYQEALREYKLEHGLSDDDLDDIIDLDGTGAGASSSSSSRTAAASATVFKQGKMSIDLGSTNVRIAHLDFTKPNNKEKNKPKVIVNREGGRCTPNAIIVETDGSTISGQMAAAKIYERSQSNNPVLNPYTLLMKYADADADADSDSNADLNTMKMTTSYALQNVLSSLATNALEQAVGGSSTSSSSSNTAGNKVLFSIDTFNSGGYNTQPIFTYPPPDTNSSSKESESLYVQLYEDAIRDMISPPSIAKFVPEPICAVKGAKYFDLLPPVTTSSSVMVIDIGGTATSISIVNENDTIQYHSRVQNFGGETIIESLMNYLCKSFYDVPTVKSVPDTMGVQRLYDASKDALKEMMGGNNNKRASRVQINIPYLSVDEKMQPKHLDMGISVKVLDAEFDDYLKNSVVPDIILPQNLLSSSLSPSSSPNDLESLFSSMIMKVFETSGQNPFTLNSVLVVGGGARSPMFRNALKGAFGKLAGEQFVEERVVLLKGALVEEMVVLGAAVSSND